MFESQFESTKALLDDLKKTGSPIDTMKLEKALDAADRVVQGPALVVEKIDITPYLSDALCLSMARQTKHLTEEWNEKVRVSEDSTEYRRILLAMIPITLDVHGPVEERHLRKLAEYVTFLDQTTATGPELACSHFDTNGVKGCLATGKIRLSTTGIGRIVLKDDHTVEMVDCQPTVPEGVTERWNIFAFVHVPKYKVFKTVTINGEERDLPIHPFAALFIEGAVGRVLAE